MEEKLLALVKKIENSHLLTSDKDHLYVGVRHALEAAVVPVLIAHLPKDRLHAFTQHLALLTPEAYIHFIVESLGDPVLDEIEQSMIEVLGVIEQTLTEAGV